MQRYYVVCSYMVQNYETKHNEYRFESEILNGDPDDMENTIIRWNTYFKDKIEDDASNIEYLTIVNWKTV